MFLLVDKDREVGDLEKRVEGPVPSHELCVDGWRVSEEAQADGLG